MAAYLDAIEERDGELHCSAHLGEEAAASDRAQGRHLDQRRGNDSGLAHLEGYVPVFDATVAAGVKEAGLPRSSARRTRTSSQWALRPSGAWAIPDPGIPPRSQEALVVGRAAAVTGWTHPGRSGSDTGGSIKQPSALCGTSACGPRRMELPHMGRRDCVQPRSDRPGREDCPRRRVITRSSLDATCVDSTTAELPHRCQARGDSLDGVRVGVPTELNEAEGIEPGGEAVDKTIALAEELGAEWGVLAPALRALRDAVLLPDRAR